MGYVLYSPKMAHLNAEIFDKALDFGGALVSDKLNWLQTSWLVSKSGCGNLPFLIHDCCCGPANGPAEQWTGERLSQGRQAAVVAWKPCTLQSTLGFGPKPRVWQVSLLLMRSWLPRLRSFLYLWRRHRKTFFHPSESKKCHPRS